MTFIKPQPSSALAALHHADHEAGIDPFAAEPASPVAPAPTPGPDIRQIMRMDRPGDRVDWRDQPPAQDIAPPTPKPVKPPKPPAQPAPKRGWRRKHPWQ